MDTPANTTDYEKAFLHAAAASPESTLVALDFDGTLSDVVPDPTQAYIHPDARDALGRLIGRIGQVAIITGRPIAEVEKLACLDAALLSKLIVLGQYGAERLDNTGRQVPESPASVRAALRDLEPLVERYRGLYIEDKHHAVGVHTRRAPAGTAQEIEPEVVAIATRHDLIIEPGREVLELRAHQISKGDTLRALIREVGAQAVAMIGDDLGDVPAFDVVRQIQSAGGVGVVVVSASDERPELASRADVTCDGPAGVAQWLDTVAPESRTAR
ncbi:MAG: trehalose-phosphatase [Propionibacteriaceae bacterium]|nr:trehalose-phosphatase [Propionibacteriaceae bacterium]